MGASPMSLKTGSGRKTDAGKDIYSAKEKQEI